MLRTSLLLITSLAMGLTQAAAAHLPSSPQPLSPLVTPEDTIVIRLPNQALLTLQVRDAAQLRELKKYQLDSLTTRLAGYIAQAEAAAKTSAAPQVTMQFYPDKDRPGQNLPEQVRITARKNTGAAGEGTRNSVLVKLAQKHGIDININDGEDNDQQTSKPRDKAARVAHRDSTRMKRMEKHTATTNLVLDFGLNALVNQKQYRTLAGAPEAVELRPEGSRYVNIGFSTAFRLGTKHSPLFLVIGPEFAFNNYMLNGNDKWVSANGRTDVVREINGRQFQKTKLATSSINLPLMLQLNLRDAHYKPTLTLAAGGFVGYRLATWTKLKYTQDGSTFKDKDHSDYNLENLQYGLQGIVGYRSLQLFAKYNMNQLFKAGQGPDTQVLSFGVRIFGN